MRTTYFFLLLAGFFSLAACSNSGEQQEAAAAAPTATNNAADVPASLTAIFAPNSGVFRGVDFSTAKEALMGMEKAELVAQTDTSASFSVDLNADEFADFEYLFRNGTLAKITLDVYSKDAASADAAYNDLKTFFDAKYLPRATLWDGMEKEALFTAFLKKMTDDPNSPGVLAVWEIE